MTTSTSFRSVLFCVVLLGIAADIGAQSPDLTVALSGVQRNISRLASGQTDGQAVFPIEQSTQVTIHVNSTVELVAVTVIGPGGQTMDSSTIGGFGGQFVSLPDSGAAQGPSIIPLLTPGYHYVFVFPSLGPGNYTARFSASGTLSQDAAVITEVTTDNQIGARLFVTESNIIQGNPAVLTAAVFEGASPVLGANVQLTIVDDTGAITNLSLTDDGTGPDTASSDGLYSGQFTPTRAGTFVASGSITGTTPTGIAFSRKSNTHFDVTSPGSRLAGTFTDRGIDDNNDGLFDRIAVNIDTVTTVPGNYNVFVTLATAGGQTLLRSQRATLAQGNQSVEVDFEASALLALGENGPYQLSLVELLFMGPNGAVPNDRLLNAGQTSSYPLTQVQRPGLRLTGITSDQGVDDNGNGKFDRLLVSVQADVLSAGAYSWALTLTDSSHREIGYAVGSGPLTAGLNNLHVQYGGAAIGASGSSGPFLLRDMAIAGPASLVVFDVGSTQAYLNTQFEGGVTAPTSIAVSPAAGRYSDVVVLTATVSPAGASGTVQFLVNGSPIPGAAQYVSSTGVATQPYTISLGQGTYFIQAGFVSSSPLFASSNGSSALTVSKAPAVVTPDPANVLTVQVSTAGGTGAFSLNAAVSGPGDTSNAIPLTCTLTPLAAGSTISVVAATTGGGVGSALNATCPFSNVPVNVYAVTFDIGGNFYTGTAQSIVTVFDPSLGFTTGGGKIVNPVTGSAANFGFTMKFVNGGTQGNLLYVEHRPGGDVTLKSTAIGPLVIVNNEGIDTGTATLAGVGNYTFVLTVFDNGEPGSNDQFGLQVNQPNGAAVPDLTFQPVRLTGGNIQIH